MVLTALDQADREAMEAVLLNGLSYEQFATQSGQSVGTVRKRLRSGLSKLQHALQAQGGKA
jgi:DNA-directed RNA polymerase specialized sigma24 family protein